MNEGIKEDERSEPCLAIKNIPVKKEVPKSNPVENEPYLTVQEFTSKPIKNPVWDAAGYNYHPNQYIEPGTGSAATPVNPATPFYVIESKLKELRDSYRNKSTSEEKLEIEHLLDWNRQLLKNCQ